MQLRDRESVLVVVRTDHTVGCMLNVVPRPARDKSYLGIDSPPLHNMNTTVRDNAWGLDSGEGDGGGGV